MNLPSRVELAQWVSWYAWSFDAEETRADVIANDSLIKEAAAQRYDLPARALADLVITVRKTFAFYYPIYKE